PLKAAVPPRRERDNESPTFEYQNHGLRALGGRPGSLNSRLSSLDSEKGDEGNARRRGRLPARARRTRSALGGTRGQHEPGSFGKPLGLSLWTQDGDERKQSGTDERSGVFSSDALPAPGNGS